MRLFNGRNKIEILLLLAEGQLMLTFLLAVGRDKKRTVALNNDKTHFRTLCHGDRCESLVFLS